MAASEEALPPADMAKVRSTLGSVVAHLETEVTDPCALWVLSQVKEVLDPDGITDGARLQVAQDDIKSARQHTKFARKHLQKIWRIVERGLHEIDGDLFMMLNRSEDATLTRASKNCNRTLRKVREWMFWAFEENRYAKGHLTEARLALKLVGLKESK